MLGRSNTRIRRVAGAVRLVGRRKIETLTLSVVAAVAAIGLVRDDSAAAAVSAATTHAVEGVSRSVITILPEQPVAQPRAGAVAAVLNRKKSSSIKPLDLAMLSHPRVDSWIKRFTTVERGSMATYLRRMDRYEKLISSELAEREMPQRLIYLAMIESGFNPKAKSPVKAAGLWQFMSPTAKRYGLKVNRRLDERTNPARSTEAALEYLSYLHDRFGSWYLAAAAYNSGEGTVSKAMKRVTGRTKGTDADFYRIARRLPRETRDYVPKLIAAAHIGGDPARYGFDVD